MSTLRKKFSNLKDSTAVDNVKEFLTGLVADTDVGDPTVTVEWKDDSITVARQTQSNTPETTTMTMGGDASDPGGKAKGAASK